MVGAVLFCKTGIWIWSGTGKSCQFMAYRMQQTFTWLWPGDAIFVTSSGWKETWIPFLRNQILKFAFRHPNTHSPACQEKVHQRLWWGGQSAATHILSLKAFICARQTGVYHHFLPLSNLNASLTQARPTPVCTAVWKIQEDTRHFILNTR